MVLEYLDIKKIIIDSEAQDYRELLKQMLLCSALKEEETILNSSIDQITKRDALMPTALGKGIAIPRLINENIKQNEIIIAINAKGLPLQGIDDKQVKIAFLLLHSRNDNYAGLIASVLRLLNDDNLRDDLIQAKNAADVLKIIQRWEQG